MTSMSLFHMVLQHEYMHVMWTCLELLKKQQEKAHGTFCFFFLSVLSMNEGKGDMLKYKKCY